MCHRPMYCSNSDEPLQHCGNLENTVIIVINRGECIKNETYVVYTLKTKSLFIYTDSTW